SADCTWGERMGTCELAGYCSFRDLSCVTGRRYANLVGDGLANQCVGTTGASPNLVPNGSFESVLDGWCGFNSERTQTTVAHSGAFGAQVCRSSPSEFTIDDCDSSVQAPRSGEIYVGSAWVRAPTTQTTPESARLYLREWVVDHVMAGPDSNAA